MCVCSAWCCFLVYLQSLPWVVILSGLISFNSMYLLTSPKCVSPGYTFLLRLRPTSSRGSAPAPGCPVGISDFSCAKVSSSSTSQRALLSSTQPLVFHGDTVLVVRARGLESSLMPLSHTRPSSQSVTPVGSVSHIPRLQHTYPAPLPTPWSTHLAYSTSHPTGLLASLAPLPT